MGISSIYPYTTAAGISRNTPYPYQQSQFPAMSVNFPMGMMQQPQQETGLIGLHGLDSAKQYPTKPNTTVPTFDMDSDHAFIIDTDANGVKSIRIINFHVISEEEYRASTEADKPIQLTQSEYKNLVDRMNTLEEELKNAQQPIRTKPDATNSNSGTDRNSAKYAGKPSTSVNDSTV